MTSGSLPFAYNDFHGGLNTHDAPYLLQDNESRDLLNVQGTTAGAIIKRTGTQILASTGLPASGLHSLFPSEATATPFLIGVGIVTGADSIFSISNSGTVTSLKSGLSTAKWEGVSGPVVSGQGPVYMMSGFDTPQQWNGVAASTTNWTATDSGGAVPSGQYMAYNQNQVFVSGVVATPSRVYWSAIADPTGWNPANLKGAGFMDFDPNDGAPITALGVVGPYVLVAKPRKLWVIISPATATARMISNNIGIASHRSIAAGPEGTFFLAEDRGVYLTNGSKIEPISDKVRPTLDSITTGRRFQAAGQYFDGHYYLSIAAGTGATTNTTTLDYDSALGTWWKHSHAVNQFTTWHRTSSTDTPQLFMANNVANTVDQAFVPNVYTDNGNPISWAWRGPWQSPTFYRRRRFPTPWFRKRLRQVRLEGSGTVDFSMARDFAGLETLVLANCLAASGGGVWGAADGSFYGGADGTTYGAPSVQRARFFSLGVANAFSMVFSATSTTADSVLEYTMMLTDRKDMVVT